MKDYHTNPDPFTSQQSVHSNLLWSKRVYVSQGIKVCEQQEVYALTTKIRKNSIVRDISYYQAAWLHQTTSSYTAQVTRQ